MRAPLPRQLPDRLPAYLPGRIHVVGADVWPDLTDLEDDRVLSAIPRYALDLRTLDLSIDVDRVRWLAERVTTRPLEARHVHLVTHGTGLHVVDGHHTLAAHLATGAERVPIALARTRVATSA